MLKSRDVIRKKFNERRYKQIQLSKITTFRIKSILELMREEKESFGYCLLRWGD